ncbi:MAG TPA: PAS domain S-box protein [Candidatus Obscuribacterales bacterium]
MNHPFPSSVYELATLAGMVAAISLSIQYYMAGRKQEMSYFMLAYAVAASLAALVALRLVTLLQWPHRVDLPNMAAECFTNLILVVAAVVHPTVRRKAQRRRFAELQQCNQKLTYRKEMFDTFMREVPGVVVIKKPNGQLLYVNDSVQRLFGISPQSVVGTFGFPYDESTATAIKKHDQEVMDTHHQLEITEVVRLNNVERTMTMSKFLIPHGKGEPLLGGVAIDMTEELARKERLAGLASIIELSPDAVYVYDEQGIVSFWNTAAEKLLGYSVNEMSGRSIEPIMPPVNKKEYEMIARTIRQHGELRNLETIRIAKDGSAKQVVISGSRTFDADGKMLCALMLRDVSQLKIMENAVASLNEQLTERIKELSRTNNSLEQARDEALRASKVKSAFIANISHELRTPLGGILGMSELVLQEKSLTADQRHLVSMIHRSAQALLDLVNDILDLSKLEAGKMNVESELFSPGNVADQCVALIRPAAMNKRLAVKVHKSQQLPELLDGDAGKVRQVLLILLSNAVKFTSEGSIDVSLSVHELSGQRRLHVLVEDTGIGVTAQDADKLFAPFSALSTPWRAEGVGLGLALAKRFVELMNGAIGFQTKPAQGSRFWFEVPFQEISSRPDAAEPSSAGAVDAAVAVPADKLKRCRVLSVEDNLVLAKLTLRQLEVIGVHIESATTVAEAVEKACSGNFDIILMDIHLPDGTGYDATEQIRTRLAQDQRAPRIIAMTAGAMEEERELALKAGMDDFLAKPVTLDDLRRTIINAL